MTIRLAVIDDNIPRRSPTEASMDAPPVESRIPLMRPSIAVAALHTTVDGTPFIAALLKASNTVGARVEVIVEDATVAGLLEREGPRSVRRLESHGNERLSELRTVLSACPRDGWIVAYGDTLPLYVRPSVTVLLGMGRNDLSRNPAVGALLDIADVRLADARPEYARLLVEALARKSSSISG